MEFVTLKIIITACQLVHSVFQIREGSQAKNPTKLASWPDKLNGELEKIWREPHLLTPQNSSSTP